MVTSPPAIRGGYMVNQMTRFMAYSNGGTTKGECAYFDRARATEQEMPLSRNGAILMGDQPDGRFFMGYDLDPKPGETLTLDDMHPDLRGTWIQQTPRGGLHAVVVIEAVPRREKLVRGVTVIVRPETTGTFKDGENDIEILHQKLTEFTMKGQNQILFGPGTSFTDPPGVYHVINDVEPIVITWETHVGILQSHVRQRVDDFDGDESYHGEHPAHLATGRVHRDRPAETIQILDNMDLAGSIDNLLERMGNMPNRWQCRDGNSSSASFQYYPDTDSWYCHKCLKGGDAIAFHAYINRISNGEAYHDLLEQFGIGVIVVDEAGERVEAVEAETLTPGFPAPFIPIPTSDKTQEIIATISHAISPHVALVGGEKGYWIHVNGPRARRIEDLTIKGWITPVLLAIEGYSTSRCTAILNVIRETCTKLDPLEVNDIDRFGNVICFQNGWLEFADDGQTTWCPPKPGMLWTAWVPHDYDPSAAYPTRFMDFMNRFSGNDANRTRRFLGWIGYILYPGNPFKKALMIYGLSNSGKSVFNEILVNIVGRDLAVKIRLANLCTGLAEGFVSADVDGKKLCHGGEVAGDEQKALTYADTEAFKDITDGMNSITINEKFKARRESWNTMKGVYGTNRWPTTAANVTELDVFMNRFSVEKAGLPWTGPKTNVAHDILLAGEIPGIINMAVEALAETIQRGDIDDDTAGRAEWKMWIDPLRSFTDECCSIGNGRIPVDDFVQALIDWLANNNIAREYTRTAITQRLQNRGVNRVDNGPRAEIRWEYAGITWQPA